MTASPCDAMAADGVGSRVAELGDQRPVLVASRYVSALVEGPQRLRTEAIVQIELILDDRPLLRVDVRDFIQRDRQGAVTAILRHELLRRRNEAVTVLGRCEPIGCPLVGGGKLGQPGGRLAGGKVRDRVVWTVALCGLLWSRLDCDRPADVET